MKRRRFLAGGVVGLAFAVGCVGRGPGSGGPNSSGETPMTGEQATVRAENRTTARTADGTPMTEETPPRTDTPAETTTHDGGIQRRVSLASVDDVPAKHRLTIEVELLESTVTAAHTARLRVTTTNTGPKRKISIGEGTCNLFNRDSGLSEEPGLVLHSPESTEWIDRSGSRWVPDRPSDEPRAYAAYGCLSRIYPKGDSVANEYVIWDDYQVAGYMTPGTYRFAEPVRIKHPDDGLDAEPTADFTWGFSVAIEKP